MDSPAVIIKQGALRGKEFATENNFDYFGFLGVPYAKPPVGELRFKAPQEPEPWKGERNATVTELVNITCPQIDMKLGSVTGTEDCLYLNVYTPKKAYPETKLPVMVYIHGGGFIFGNGVIKDEAGPDFLIEQDVVVVSINYRIGIFGFLCLDIPEVQGNMGLKDQVQALKWVKENIASFGGNPSNVTLFGISAGSASIDYLIVSPMSRNLFQRAILQSGAAVNHWARNFRHKTLAWNIAKRLGYNGDKNDMQSLYEALNSKSVPELLRCSFDVIESVMDEGLYFGLVPTIEKEFDNTEAFLTENSYNLLKRGEFNKIPTIRGFCSFEGLLMSAMKPNIVKNVIEKCEMVNILPFKFEGTAEEVNNELKSIYLKNAQKEDEKDTFALKFFSDLDFTAGVWASGKAVVEHNIPLFMYEFSYDGDINYLKKMFGLMKPGASHGDDTAYVLNFKNLIGSRSERDKIVCNHFAKLWTNFAKTGNPTPDTAENILKWLPFTKEQTNYLVIDEALSMRKDYEPERMGFFENMYEKYESLNE